MACMSLQCDSKINDDIITRQITAFCNFFIPPTSQQISMQERELDKLVAHFTVMLPTFLFYLALLLMQGAPVMLFTFFETATVFEASNFRQQYNRERDIICCKQLA